MAALTHPSHVLMYAPGDSFPCRVTRPVASPLRGQRKRCSKRQAVLSCNSSYLGYNAENEKPGHNSFLARLRPLLAHVRLGKCHFYITSAG
ncbi:hypothetical protein B9J96_14535 [Enterobacter roggenkampii]|nr:hypothetical protein B9J96_14535 [Enterobacter roggenkampii]